MSDFCVLLCNNDHQALSRWDSTVLASRKRSGLMTYGGFTLALLERMDATSVDLFSVIKIALGRPIGLNLPSFLPSTSIRTAITLFKSA